MLQTTEQNQPLSLDLLDGIFPAIFHNLELKLQQVVCILHGIKAGDGFTV